MVAEVRSDYPSEYQAMSAVAQMLGVGSPETIRTWIRRQQVDAGDRPGVTTDAAVEIKRLKRENAELRRANEILKAASAFFSSARRRARVVRVDAHATTIVTPTPSAAITAFTYSTPGGY